MLISKKKALRKTAVNWFIRLQNLDIESSDRHAFEVWLMSSHMHQEAYAEVSSMWQNLESTVQLDQLASALQHKNKSSKSSKLKLASAAFSLVLTIFSGLYIFNWRQSQPTLQMAIQTVNTANIGQTKTQVLEDGSRLTLNASSNLEVIYYRDKRLVKLNRGEVIFEVAKKVNRPFVVESENARITVMGTRFAVNKLDGLIRVSVDHGRISVNQIKVGSSTPQQALVLINGEVAEIITGAAPKKVDRLAQDAFSFERGLITFTNADLKEISETLSRYRQQPVYLKAGQPVKVKITAIIKSRNVEKFLNNLPNIGPVKLEQQKNQLVISEK